MTDSAAASNNLPIPSTTVVTTQTLVFHPVSFVTAEWLCPCGRTLSWFGKVDSRAPELVPCPTCGTVRRIG